MGGSPPPTRGIPFDGVVIAPSFRITPAYAGNTDGKSSGEELGQDHPRLRGEYSL